MKILILLVLLLTGCGYITPSEFEKATELCVTHGGLKAIISGNYSYVIEAKCNDSSYIKKVYP